MDIETRFWSKVDRRGPDECWPWLGTRVAAGYGQLWVGGRQGRNKPATHVALEVAGTPLPAGMFALHRCDNPPCVNPEHLFAGTARDNREDAIAKGRWRTGLAPLEVRRRITASVWARYTPAEREARVAHSRAARQAQARRAR